MQWLGISRLSQTQGGDTPIDAVVRAATGLISEILTPYTKERLESLHIIPYTIYRRSTAEIQRSQTAKCLCGQAAKVMVKIS